MRANVIGIIAGFFVLIVLFRALVPTAIPLIFAIVAVATAFLLLFLAARITNFNTITEILVPMIGLGVGIDYTLFIVTRFRQLLHDGLDPQEAAAAAGATAGRAVVFAGDDRRDLDHGPRDHRHRLHHQARHRERARRPHGRPARELDAAGRALAPRPQDRSRPARHEADRRLPCRPGPDPVAAWGRFVSRNAKIVLPLSIILLLLLASPVLGVRLGLADSSTAPKDQTTRKAYDLLSSPDGFGAGFTAPIPVVIDLADDHDAAAKLETAMKDVPGVKEVAAPIYNAKTADQASVAIINAYSRYAPQDARTDDIVSELRDNTIPQVLDGSSAKAYVSGANAAFTDIGDIIFSRAPYFLLYIIGVTFIVLAMAFRSVVIATKAALTTLMSALVGFGVLTLVVQLGHGMGLIGLDQTGPIESFVPPIAFAILFGLSMDYEVFLMSRIREEHIHGEDTISAVKDGMAGVGRVILAAALIMSSVFFSFLLTPDRVSKEFGLLLGVAILTDAIIIRLTLVPALLSLLEEHSWAMPAWLDRALPNLTIEPPGQRQEPHEAGARREPAPATD